MEFKDTKFWKFWLVYGNHITAVTIAFFLIFSSVQLYNFNKLQKEISINCGWGEEDHYCYCEKSEAMMIKNKMQGDNLILDYMDNVSLAG